MKCQEREKLIVPPQKKARVALLCPLCQSPYAEKTVKQLKIQRKLLKASLKASKISFNFLESFSKIGDELIMTCKYLWIKLQ